jgi:O-antigen ligase
MSTRSRPQRVISQSRTATPWPTNQSPSARGGGLANKLSWLIVVFIAVSVPLVYTSTAKEAFRFPKELLLRAGGIALCAVVISQLMIEGRRSLAHWPRQLLYLVAAVASWSITSTVFSTNRDLSAQSLLTVGAAMIFFVAAYNGASHRPLSVLYVAFAPALINAVIAIAQRTGVWNPVPLDSRVTGRMATIALLGNPNDVGMFLLAPSLAAVVLAVTSRKHFVPATALALTLAAGLILSETLGAIIPYFVGVFLIFVRMQPRRTIVIAILMLLAAITFLTVSPQRWSRTQNKFSAAATGDIDPLLSGRLPAFIAAWRMFRAHPAFGLGLGCFRFHYFDEKIAVEKEHPWLLNRNPANFGEAHNEHLQILAEGGLPAYAIFVAAFVLLARASFTTPAENGGLAGAFARRLAFPLSAAVFILALSSFPFRLAGPTVSILFLGAITLAWSERE